MKRVILSKQKEPYVKPEMTIITVDFSNYNEIMTMLKVEDIKAKEQENIPTAECG